MRNESATWEQEEFGQARLGDVRNERRLLLMAACVARHSAGKVSEVFETQAQQQGAYDFLENDNVLARDIAQAMFAATAERCRAHAYIVMPEDGSSLTITDDLASKGVGPIGTRKAKARGLKMINCIAVSPQGVPLGLLAQQWWVRSDAAPTKKKTHAHKSTENKETQHWLDAEQSARDVFSAAKLSTRIWTQKDREADSWPQILDALEHSAEQWTTIRASWNRRLAPSSDESEPEYLWQRMSEQAACGSYKLKVLAGANRKAREAHMQVRFCTVQLALKNKRTKERMTAEIGIVCTEEVGTTPEGEKPICWRLLTTYPVSSLLDAILVIDNYAKRWLIEQFHKAWKSGQCNVEEMQLRSPEAMMKWATILAANAMRLQRLVYLARVQPKAKATEELSLDEIKAAAVLQESKASLTHAAEISIEQAVAWIAMLGGYTGRSSGGPPGMIVIARGLRDIAVSARTLALMRARGTMALNETNG